MVNKKGTFFCEITPPVYQYSVGVYAFRSQPSYTLAHFWDLSKYVWLEDDILGVKWLKNAERDISGELSKLNDNETKYFFLVKIRAKYM